MGAARPFSVVETGWDSGIKGQMITNKIVSKIQCLDWGDHAQQYVGNHDVLLLIKQ